MPHYSAPSVPDVRFDDEESAFGAALAAPRRQGSDLPPGWTGVARAVRRSWGILGDLDKAAGAEPEPWPALVPSCN